MNHVVMTTPTGVPAPQHAGGERGAGGGPVPVAPRVQVLLGAAGGPHRHGPQRAVPRDQGPRAP